MSSAEHEVLDMVCIGFGPASLAIAVALEDWVESNSNSGQQNSTWPKVRFLEKQESFRWHAGMLIPSAKMQISFIKDLATTRNPGSRFTFLNYLKEHGRLAHFARLNTFLPARAEFADYMRWTAGHFKDRVSYGHKVLQVRPIKKHQRTTHFEVEARQRSTGDLVRFYTKQVVIGIGGSPVIPAAFHINQPYILHSSQYMTHIDTVLPNRQHAYQIAVIGSGQSAAEIFDDLSRRRPNAHTTLIFRDTALRPSDDSPFVNEVFDPSAIDIFYRKPAPTRKSDVRRDRATNYSVVRLELLEKIYRDLGVQRMRQPDTSKHLRRILPATEIDAITPHSLGDAGARATLTLRTAGTTTTHALSCDAVILATGYSRKAHLAMLRPCRELNPSSSNSEKGSGVLDEWSVRRDYSVVLTRHAADVGIWLQGCNEETHGLSDSLLSVLAVRGGELVRSIFEGKRDTNGELGGERGDETGLLRASL